MHDETSIGKDIVDSLNSLDDMEVSSPDIFSFLNLIEMEDEKYRRYQRIQLFLFCLVGAVLLTSLSSTYRISFEWFIVVQIMSVVVPLALLPIFRQKAEDVK